MTSAGRPRTASSRFSSAEFPGNPVRVLVAGVGNMFLRDDGFGPEVARRIAAEAVPAGRDVRVVDYGIRGMHLAYDLLGGVDVLVLVDAVPPDASGKQPPEASG